MAILQISRITQRKGLQENLPQLAGAELGWSIDQRRLYIGNGTLEEGAPTIGNTEILTEFSDIFDTNASYTYKGLAAGYTVQTGATAGNPVTQNLQTWMDQWASVKDFGAVGDGVTDDTDAINRAIYQLYCRALNPEIRRGLFFPAGIYRTTGTILIPPYAYLYGEGANSSIIQLDAAGDSTLNPYVARTCDSLAQTGASIGDNGAVTPRFITVNNMSFQSLDETPDIFLVEDAINCRFQNINFAGPLLRADLNTAIQNTACVRFASTASFVCSQVVFDGCCFGGTTYGINTNQQVRAAIVTASQFDTLYQGLVLGEGPIVNGGPSGFRVVSSIFNNIYAEGIIFGSVSLNASLQNSFYDVGNHFNGTTNPASVIIDIQQSNNISLGDVFERGDAYSNTYERVNVSNTESIATVNGRYLKLGDFYLESARSVTLSDNIVDGTVFTVSAAQYPTFEFRYSIERNGAYRTGVFTVATGINFSDDYVEGSATGVTLTATEAAGVITVSYTTTGTGFAGEMKYSINRLI